jgi:hypothetical protein
MAKILLEDSVHSIVGQITRGRTYKHDKVNLNPFIHKFIIMQNMTLDDIIQITIDKSDKLELNKLKPNKDEKHSSTNHTSNTII